MKEYTLADRLGKLGSFGRLREFLERIFQPGALEAAEFEAFEVELHEHVGALEAELTGEMMSRFDVDMAEIEVDGEIWRRVLRCEEDYVAPAGTARVNRSLFARKQRSDAPGAGKTICPMELRLGIVSGKWTPWAARLMGAIAARMPSREGEELFQEFHGMTPSRSSLERVVSTLGERWEANREAWEDVLRSQETVPAEAVQLGVSLDGVMLPTVDEEGRVKAQDEDKQASGPISFKEAGCGTVSLYDAEGNRLETVRYGRMPEYKKKTLTSQLKAEVDSILAARPDLRLVTLGDAAKENWRFLEGTWPDAVQMVDIYHGFEHLKDGLDAYYGKKSPKAKREFTKLRHVLKEEGGVETVIRALAYRRDQAKSRSRTKEIGKQLGYFRRNRARMQYAEALAKNIPIGSGVVEAACKTLVAQRMKCAGMKWRMTGNGQAILTLRSLQQSNRWGRGWGLLASSFRRPVFRVYRSNDRVLKVAI